MATDNVGRECSGITPQEIAHQMQDPVKQAGAGEIVSAINSLIAAQKETNKGVNAAIRATLGSNAALANKLESIKETLDRHLDEAKGFNTKVKEAKTSKPSLSEMGISKIIRDNTKPSRELKDIRDTITSKNTVHVKEKELRKLTGYLIKAIESLASAIDPSKAAKFTEELPKSLKKTPKIIISGDGFYKDESGSPSHDAKRPGASKVMGGDGFYKEERKKPSVKSGSADWFEKIVRAEAKRLFNVKDFRYAAPGEGGIQHRAFNEQMKKTLEGKSVGDIKKVVELEEGRIRNAKLFFGYEDDILKLRKKIVDLGKMEIVDHEALKKAQDDYYNKLEEILKKKESLKNQIWGLIGEVGALGEKAYEVGYGFNFVQKATEGVLTNQRKVIQEAGELAALQQTSAKHIRDQSIYVSKLGESSRSWFMRNQAVARTGKKQVEVELQQYKNQRKGLKDTQQATRLAEKGLALSTALGSNAEQTAEYFRVWSMEMGLSNRQLGQMSISMKGVANSTGIVGDELLKVVENTKNSMNNMRNLGTLTAEAATKLMELNAEAQKLGVGARMQEMNDFLTTGVKKWGTSKLTPFIAQSLQAGINKLHINPAQAAEMQQQLVHGQLPTNAKGMQALAAGYKEMRNQIAGGKGIKDMNSDELRRANLNAQAYGFEGIGELDRVIKAQEKANRSYTERLDELTKERAGTNLKELDKIQRANLLMKETTLKFGETTKLLTKMQEGNALNDNEAKAFKIQGASTPEQKKVLMAETLKSYKESREQAIAAGANKANLGPGLTQKDLAQAAKTGDVEKFLEKATTADQQLQNEMISLSNPITQQLTELKHINSFLTSTFGGFATWITQNSLVRTIAGISGGIAALYNTYQTFSRVFPRMANATEKSALQLATMLRAMTHRGSIYVHDIHVEQLLRHMDFGGGGMGGRRGRGGVGDIDARPQRSPDWLRQARKRPSISFWKRPSDSSWGKGLPGVGRSGRGMLGRMPRLGRLGGGLSKIGGGLSTAGGVWSMLGLPGADYVDDAMMTADYADTARSLMPKGMTSKAGSWLSRTLNSGKGLIGKGLSAGKGLLAPVLGAGKGLIGKGASLLPKFGTGAGGAGTAAGGLTAAGAATTAGALYGAHVLEDLVLSGIEVARNPNVLKERDQAALGNMSGGGLKSAGGYVKNVGGNLLRPGMSIIEMANAEKDIIKEAPATAIDTYKWTFGKKAQASAKGKENAWALDEKTFYKMVEDLGAKSDLTPKEQGMLQMAQANLARMAKDSGGKFGAHPPTPKPTSVETSKTTLSEGGIKLQTASPTLTAATPPTPTVTSTMMPNIAGTMGVGNIEQKIKAEEVNKNPDKATSTMATNLSGVEANTAQSNEQLKILVEHIKTLVTVLTSGGSEHGRPNTKSKIQPNILPNYYTWNTGDYSTLPSKGPIMPGV